MGRFDDPPLMPGPGISPGELFAGAAPSREPRGRPMSSAEASPSLSRMPRAFASLRVSAAGRPSLLQCGIAQITLFPCTGAISMLCAARTRC